MTLCSIITCTHNRLEYTRMFAESLLRCTDVPFEAIFVDNGSTDGTPEYLARLPRVRLIRNPVNRGVPRGWNQGLRAAGGGILVVCNNDVVLTPGWLGKLVGALAADARLGMVVPVTNIHVLANPGTYAEEAAFLAAHPPAGPDWASLDAAYDGFFRFAEAFGKKYRDLRLPHPSFDCVVLRREAVEDVGPFEEGFGLAFMEDVDFVQRLLLNPRYNLAVSCGAVYVHHYGNRTTGLVGGADLYRRAAERFEAKWAPASSSIYWDYVHGRIGPEDLERLRRRWAHLPFLASRRAGAAGAAGAGGAAGPGAS